MNKRVYFIGAGPGDPELITIKALNIIKKADIIIYAGSLINPSLLDHKKAGAELFDSSGMNLGEIVGLIVSKVAKDSLVARLQCGDTSIYSAIKEQITELKKHDIESEVIPGVSSYAASAALLKEELTLPGISQTIILTRRSGRTLVHEREGLQSLSMHKATICIFLSIDKIDEVVMDLKSGYSDLTPVAVVYRAGWEDQKILRGYLRDIAERVGEAGIKRQALIIVGEALREDSNSLFYSKLYDKGFSHGFRE